MGLRQSGEGRFVGTGANYARRKDTLVLPVCMRACWQILGLASASAAFCTPPALRAIDGGRAWRHAAGVTARRTTVAHAGSGGVSGVPWGGQHGRMVDTERDDLMLREKCKLCRGGGSMTCRKCFGKLRKVSWCLSWCCRELC